MWKHQEVFPLPLMTKGEIKLKEHDDRGRKYNMMTWGARNMLTYGYPLPLMPRGREFWSKGEYDLNDLDRAWVVAWVLPSMTKEEIVFWIVIDTNKGPTDTIKLSLMSPWALHGLAIFYMVMLDGHIEILMEPAWNPWWSPCQLHNDMCFPNYELMMWLGWLTHGHGSCGMMYWWKPHYVG